MLLLLDVKLVLLLDVKLVLLLQPWLLVFLLNPALVPVVQIDRHECSPPPTDLEGGGSGGGRGAVTTRGTAPGKAPSGTDLGTPEGCTNGGSARTSKELPSSSPSNTDVRGGTADSGRELSCRVGNGFFLGLPRLGLSDCALGGRM